MEASEGGELKKLYKLPRSWRYVVHPLGYDPYDSYSTSYMVDTVKYDLHKVNTKVVDMFTKNQEARADVALAGVYTSPGALL
jgi:hypothetical protein